MNSKKRKQLFNLAQLAKQQEQTLPEVNVEVETKVVEPVVEAVEEVLPEVVEEVVVQKTKKSKK